jgi:hypothetical protein
MSTNLKDYKRHTKLGVDVVMGWKLEAMEANQELSSQILPEVFSGS